jgi:hypothetical protein
MIAAKKGSLMKQHQLLFGSRKAAVEAQERLVENFKWVKGTVEYPQKHAEGYLLTFSTEGEALSEKMIELITLNVMPTKATFNL